LEVALTVNDPVLWADPRVEELEAELAELGHLLSAVEAELLQARARLDAFTRIHDRLLGPLYAELDEIEAQIAQRVAVDSARADDVRAAETARERARQSAMAAQDMADDPVEPAPVPPPPADALRALYRSLVKRCHPDLGGDDAQRLRRNEFMALVNDAYARNDVPALHRLATEWDHLETLTDPTTTTTADRMARLLAAVASARHRLSAARSELVGVTSSRLGRLLFSSEDPRTALDTLVAHVRDRVERRRRQLAQLRGA
jgi:hypothetical protein